jgi:hypothetical protein
MVRKTRHQFINRQSAQRKARHKTHQQQTDIPINDAIFELKIKQQDRLQRDACKTGRRHEYFAA